MADPVEQLAYLSSGATTKRRLDAQDMGEQLNVKDFGAFGNGSTDDTTAIQACFNEAFGPWDAPNGINSRRFNRPVYFPAGEYMVSNSFTRNIVGTAAGTSDEIVVQVSSSVSGQLVDGDIVYIQGAIGTFGGASASPLHTTNGVYVVVVQDATHVRLRTSQYTISPTDTWVSGGTITKPALRLNSIAGGWIYGAGRVVSQLTCTTPNVACVLIDGLYLSRIEGLEINGHITGGMGIHVGQSPNALVTMQSDTFANCMFGGGKYSCAIGFGSTGNCSENTFFNCYFTNSGLPSGVGTGPATGVGLYIRHYNALSQVVLGGNFGRCGYGIFVEAGGVPCIDGTGFQNYWDHGTPGIDIFVNNSSGETFAVTGCRSESKYFIRCLTGTCSWNISGCASKNVDVGGFFFWGSGNINIAGCSSEGFSKVIGANANVTISGSHFPDAGFLDDAAGTMGAGRYNHLTVFPMLITTQVGAAYSITESDGGSKIIFNRATAQTVTIGKNSTGALRLDTGTVIKVQQMGAGKVTFAGASGVTLNSRGSLKSLNGAGACGVLTCDGVDTWSLEGDIVA